MMKRDGKAMQHISKRSKIHTGGKHKGNRSLGRPRPRWEDNIKTDFK
jgi:hypothetical protein